MSEWVVLAAVGGGALAVRRWLRNGETNPAQIADIAKTGELFGLAADWLRNGDVDSARAVLNLISREGWQFAYDEVVLPSRQPRIAVMAGRMSAAALLATPSGTAANADRLAQVETLAAIANEIKRRTWLR